MNEHFASAMRRATAAVRDGQPHQATSIIRSALNLGDGTDAVTPHKAARPMASDSVPARDPSAMPGLATLRTPSGVSRTSGRLSHPLGTVVKTLNARPVQNSAPIVPATPGAPTDARFISRTFKGRAGSRDYRLFVPQTKSGAPNGLVVMLHGCNQDPDDFAAGTEMNRLAAAHGLLVAYPGQTRRANMSGCWNWFDPDHQRRDDGEPAIIAGLTMALLDEFAIPSGRVFVAGLSAGGAMAAVVAATYPEPYAAAGIHSGLGYGAATDMMSAFSAMAGSGGPLRAAPLTAARTRLIIVHGTADKTVAPSNAATIFDAMADASPCLQRRVGRVDSSSSGRSEFVHQLFEGDIIVAEMRMVEGMGHAWAGGSEAGSYTDPTGPDSSAAMVRFFLAPDARA
ncbi:esterase [Acuticoccus sediminis]|uniref:Esterase n=1 Tax=Acuticoccus sediminis TaxID=2184697 RepID=A0A8B2NG20_9HYPH|nr:PHB depolymerase family esterase [Acuticoccus sediminis]RAH95889.1 esterase [Acuticoccus sediminis]